MVIWDCVSWSQKVREEKFILFIAEKAAWKRLHENCKKFTIKCALLFSCGWVRERGVFAVRLLGGRVGREKNPRWLTTLVFAHFQHFSSASNISARIRQTFRLDARKCWELINLTMTPPKTITSPKTITMPKTTTHIYEHFLCFCISQKLPVTKF
jgi:hypothetical protein